MKRKFFQYKNIDIIKALEIIAADNTHYYLQNDFEVDKRTLLENAKKDYPETMLWMSRDCGTWCFSEKKVFMRNSTAHQTWTYYENHRDNIFAYAIEVAGMEKGVWMGNLYELDYHTHVKTVRQSAVHADNCEFVFENGTAIYPASELSKWQYGHPQLGKYQASFPIPNDEEKLKVVLMEEKKKRGKLMEASCII